MDNLNIHKRKIRKNKSFSLVKSLNKKEMEYTLWLKINMRK